MKGRFLFDAFNDVATGAAIATDNPLIFLANGLYRGYEGSVDTLTKLIGTVALGVRFRRVAQR